MTLTCGAFAAGEKYDGVYDRPSYYTDFKLPHYMNNMSYLIKVKDANGELISNYEIGVYDQNGKLVAIGRSIIEQEDYCALTIQGNLGDVFHMEVVYGDFVHPTIEPLEEIIPFVIDAVVGNKEDVFFHVASVPTLDYWTTDYLAAEPVATLKATELDAADLTQATRIELRGLWAKESVEGLFAGCTQLLYVTLGSMPASTDGAFTGANPNCLVYLPLGTTEDQVPEGWTNCVAGNLALTDINLTDGTTTQPCNFFCPQTIDLNGHQATFHRSSEWGYANGQGGWNTIILPFDAKVQADGEVVSALTSLNPTSSAWKKQAGFWASVLDYGVEGEDLEFSLTPSLSANTPYLFALPSHNFEKTISGTKYSLNMEGKEIVFVGEDEIPATPATLVSEDEDPDNDYHLLGTYQTLMGQPMYQLKTNVADGSDAFVYREKGNLLPFRAYMAVDDAGSVKADVMVINMGWEEYGDTADGLSMTVADAASKKVYDLSGRAVMGQPAHGIYVINGRKVIK